MKSPKTSTYIPLDKVLSKENTITPKTAVAEETKPYMPLSEVLVVDPSVPNTPDTNIHRIKTDGYSDYVKNITPNMDLAKEAAHAQTGWQQFGRTAANMPINIAATIIESAGYLAELPSIITGNSNYTNPLIAASQEIKNPFGDIYRKNPNEVFGLSDSAWWYQNGSGLIESIASFFVTGAGVGKALSTGAKLANRGIKNIAVPFKRYYDSNFVFRNSNPAYANFDGLGISKLILPAARTAATANMAGAYVGTAASLAYVEGAMSGTEIFNEKYDYWFNLTNDEAFAKQKASEAANTTIAYNTAINTLLNLTSVAPLFNKLPKFKGSFGKEVAKKTGETTTEWANRLKNLSPEYKLSIANSFKTLGIEMTQEAAEELVNVASERLGRGESITLADALREAAESEEGQLSMILGAFGGIGQTALMQNIPLHKTSDPTTGKTVWESARTLSNKEKQRAQTAAVSSLIKDIEKVEKLQEEIAKYGSKNDDASRARTNALKQELFNLSAYQSIRSESQEYLINTLKNIANTDNSKAIMYDEIENVKLLEQQIEALENKIQVEGDPNNKPLLDELQALQTQKEELEAQIEQNEGHLTAAQKAGLSENAESELSKDEIGGAFYYKNLAKENISRIKQYEKEYDWYNKMYDSPVIADLVLMGRMNLDNLKNYQAEMESKTSLLTNLLNTGRLTQTAYDDLLNRKIYNQNKDSLVSIINNVKKDIEKIEKDIEDLTSKGKNSNIFKEFKEQQEKLQAEIEKKIKEAQEASKKANATKTKQTAKAKAAAPANQSQATSSVSAPPSSTPSSTVAQNNPPSTAGNPKQGISNPVVNPPTNQQSLEVPVNGKKIKLSIKPLNAPPKVDSSFQVYYDEALQEIADTDATKVIALITEAINDVANAVKGTSAPGTNLGVALNFFRKDGFNTNLDAYRDLINHALGKAFGMTDTEIKALQTIGVIVSSKRYVKKPTSRRKAKKIKANEKQTLTQEKTKEMLSAFEGIINNAKTRGEIKDIDDEFEVYTYLRNVVGKDIFKAKIQEFEMLYRLMTTRQRVTDKEHQKILDYFGLISEAEKNVIMDIQPVVEEGELSFISEAEFVNAVNDVEIKDNHDKVVDAASALAYLSRDYIKIITKEGRVLFRNKSDKKEDNLHRELEGVGKFEAGTQLTLGFVEIPATANEALNAPIGVYKDGVLVGYLHTYNWIAATYEDGQPENVAEFVEGRNNFDFQKRLIQAMRFAIFADAQKQIENGVSKPRLNAVITSKGDGKLSLLSGAAETIESAAPAVTEYGVLTEKGLQSSNSKEDANTILNYVEKAPIGTPVMMINNNKGQRVAVPLFTPRMSQTMLGDTTVTEHVLAALSFFLRGNVAKNTTAPIVDAVSLRNYLSQFMVIKDFNINDVNNSKNKENKIFFNITNTGIIKIAKAYDSNITTIQTVEEFFDNREALLPLFENTLVSLNKKYFGKSINFYTFEGTEAKLNTISTLDYVKKSFKTNVNGKNKIETTGETVYFEQPVITMSIDFSNINNTKEGKKINLLEAAKEKIFKEPTQKEQIPNIDEDLDSLLNGDGYDIFKSVKYSDKKEAIDAELTNNNKVKTKCK